MGSSLDGGKEDLDDWLRLIASTRGGERGRADKRWGKARAQDS